MTVGSTGARPLPVVVVVDPDPDRQRHLAALLGPGVRSASGATGLTRVLAACDRRRPVVVVLGLHASEGDAGPHDAHCPLRAPEDVVHTMAHTWPSPTAVVGVAPGNGPGDLAAALDLGMVDLVAVGGPDVLLRHAVRRAGTALMAGVAPVPRPPVAPPVPGCGDVELPADHRRGGTTNEATSAPPADAPQEGDAATGAPGTLAPPVADHRDVAAAGPPPPRSRGRVAVLSAKGGAGASTVAANLAVLLARHDGTGPPAPVVAVDGDFQFGDLGVLFNVDVRASLASALRPDGTVPADTDARLSQSLVTQHEPTGVGVVCAPTDPVAAEQLSPALVLAVLGHLEAASRWVVVDLWSRIDDVVADIVASADVVVIVTTLDLASVKDTGVAVRTLVRLGIPPGRCRLVCNDAGRPGDLELHQVQAHSGLPVAAVVPRDDAVPLALRQGVPVVEGAPGSLAAAGLAAVAASVVGAPPPVGGDVPGCGGPGPSPWGRLRRRLWSPMPTGERTGTGGR